jgi:hypothetical protein
MSVILSGVVGSVRLFVIFIGCDVSDVDAVYQCRIARKLLLHIHYRPFHSPSLFILSCHSHLGGSSLTNLSLISIDYIMKGLGI